MKLTASDTMSINSEIQFLTNHIKECRRKHKKINLDFLKFHVKSLYEWIVQIEMLNSGLGAPRVGIDIPNW